MSTRCQVKVVQTELWDDAVTLYHHCDGYPENIIPLINKTLQAHIKRHDDQMIKWKLSSKDQGKPRWEAGRAGKVASMLCSADPEEFEPEQGHKLHGDIEYYYVLYVPSWEVEVFTLDDAINPVIKHHRQSIADLMVLYPKNHPNHEV